MKKQIEHTPSSGNVFADLGLPNPEQALAKAELALQINEIIAERKLNQNQAAQILGVDQPRISALSKGRLAAFSLEKLMVFAAKLGNNVKITLEPSPSGGIMVAAAPFESSLLAHCVYGYQQMQGCYRVAHAQKGASLSASSISEAHFACTTQDSVALPEAWLSEKLSQDQRDLYVC